MKQLLVNLLLYIVAVSLYVFIYPIGLAYHFINGGSIKGYLLSTATTIDKVAGWEFRSLWNRTFIKGINKQEFNDIRFTMSYFLGVNKERNTLTKLGKSICSILNFFDKNHVEKAVEQVRNKYF